MENKLNKMVSDLLKMIVLSMAIVFVMAIIDLLLTNLN
jgi:hypothetical protein